LDIYIHCIASFFVLGIDQEDFVEDRELLLKCIVTGTQVGPSVFEDESTIKDDVLVVNSPGDLPKLNREAQLRYNELTQQFEEDPQRMKNEIETEILRRI